MKEQIKKHLTQIEQEKEIKILLACETGSRAWGFPSPDSDYDIRMIYVHPMDWYLSLTEKKDTIEHLKELQDRKLILLECLSGSKAYGLATPTSDTDIKGVFLLPKQDFYGLEYVPQVANPSNDIVFYEFSRFMQLLSVNNPNILELLNTPASATHYKHPLLDKIKSELILSKLCKETFGKFALAQIKKAKGLRKKIVNPVGKERKSPLSFCYVSYGQGSLALNEYLNLKGWRQQDCGLTNVPHMKHTYGLYHRLGGDYNGLIKKMASNDLSLSSIPKGQSQETLLYFNKDGYSTYCKEYREYWDWVNHRNEARYENTQSHGKNYDAKNMMHTFRLLDMAIEIGREQRVNVKRPNREFLLDIKAGKYDYDELLRMAEEKQLEMEQAFAQSSLPDQPDLEAISNLAYKLRDKFYEP